MTRRQQSPQRTHIGQHKNAAGITGISTVNPVSILHQILTENPEKSIVHEIFEFE